MDKQVLGSIYQTVAHYMNVGQLEELCSMTGIKSETFTKFMETGEFNEFDYFRFTQRINLYGGLQDKY